MSNPKDTTYWVDMGTFKFTLTGNYDNETWVAELDYLEPINRSEDTSRYAQTFITKIKTESDLSNFFWKTLSEMMSLTRTIWEN